MNPLLAALAVAVVAGGVVAVSARDPRSSVLGITLAAVAAPLLADPLPELLPVAARIVGALLAGYLLWIGTRDAPVASGSRLGWPAETAIAAAAAFAGLATGEVGVAATITTGGGAGTGPESDLLRGIFAVAGPPEALAAAFALAALAIAPLLDGRDLIRLGHGLLVAVLGAGLLHAAVAPAPSAMEQLGVTGLLIAVAGGTALLATTAIQAVGAVAVSSAVGPGHVSPAMPRPAVGRPAERAPRRPPATTSPASAAVAPMLAPAETATTGAAPEPPLAPASGPPPAESPLAESPPASSPLPPADARTVVPRSAGAARSVRPPRERR